MSAIPDIPESGGQYVGAAGQFVAAVLHTAGLYGQDEVLRNFTPILKSLGAGFFAVALFGAIMSIALFGNYKRALFLLFTPPLFFWMLNHRMTVASAKLQFGDHTTQRSDKQQRAFLGRMDYEPVQKALPEVSWFYVQVDRVVSSIVQGTVAVLLNNENAEDIVSVAKERAFAQLFSAGVKDPRYLKLVSKGMIGQCGEGMNKHLALGRIKSELAAEQALGAKADAAKVAKLTAQRDKLQTEVNSITSLRVVPLDPDLLDLQELYSQPRKTPISCRELWDLVKIGSKEEIKYIIEQSVKDAGKDPLSDFSSAATPDVKNKVKDELLKTLNESDSAAAYNIAAAYLLKAALSNTAHDSMTRSIVGNARFNNLRRSGIYDDIADADSKGGFLALIHFAGMIPYIQGLMLYLLSITFPFFCLFILIPGRLMSFFTWPALWVWVKSWDVGFAMVHVLRKILWHFVSHGVNDGRTPIDWNDPSSVFALIYKNDPIATLNTYYVIIGIATFAVPVLTAQCCMGASNVLGSLNPLFEDSKGLAKWQAAKWRRIQVSTKVEALAKQRIELAGLAAAEKKAKSDDAEMRYLRSTRNGGAMARAIDAEYRRGKYDYQFGEENAAIRGFLSAATGRPMSYTRNTAASVLEGDVDRVSRQYNVAEASILRAAGVGEDALKDQNTSPDLPSISGDDYQSDLTVDGV